MLIAAWNGWDLYLTVNLVKFCHDYLADREIVRIFAPNQLLLT